MKFIDDQSLATFEDRKTKIIRPEQPSSLWTCSSKIFGGCQEIKQTSVALDEKKIPYWQNLETCNLHCGLPSDLINEMSSEFFGGRATSNLRGTSSLLRDLEKNKEEMNDRELLRLTNFYIRTQKSYLERKISFKSYSEMEEETIQKIGEIFKQGLGKDYYNEVLKRILLANNDTYIIYIDFVSIQNLAAFNELISYLPKFFSIDSVYEGKSLSSSKISRFGKFLTLSNLLKLINNVSSPWTLEIFLKKYPNYLGRLTTILDNIIDKRYADLRTLINAEPIFYNVILYSPLFLKYYLEHSRFKRAAKLIHLLHDQNNNSINLNILQPISPRVEALQEIYLLNQVILDAVLSRN
jgi:hypothetical protein